MNFENKKRIEFKISMRDYTNFFITFGFVIAVLVSLFIFLYYNINYNINFLSRLHSKIILLNVIYNCVLYFIYGLMILTIILFFIMTYVLFSMYGSRTIAILNSDGIWLRKYKFISWKDIRKIFIYESKYLGPSQRSLAVLLKDDFIKNKKVIFPIKIAIFLSNILRTPHITFGSMYFDENLKLLNIAKKYHESFNK